MNVPGKILLFLLCLTVAGPLHSAKENSLKYNWKPIKGANGYLIQIKNSSDEVILNEQVNTSSLTFTLPQGEYTHRISALNKFRKPGKWSPWIPFNIRKSDIPDINVIETAAAKIDPKKPEESKNKRELTITGKNFLNASRVTIKSDEGDIPISKIDVKSDDTLVLTADMDKMKPGNYSVRIENPGEKIKEVPNALTLTKKETGGMEVLASASVKRLTPEELEAKEREAKELEAKEREAEEQKAKEQEAKEREAKELEAREQEAEEQKAKELEAEEQKAKELETKERMKEFEPEEVDHLILDPLTPMITQFKYGKKQEGFFWTGFFGSLTVAGYSEWSKANQIAMARKNDMVLNIYSNTTLYSILGSSLTSSFSQEESLAMGLYALNENKRLESSYNRHRNNQGIIGGVAFAGYLAHVYGVSLKGWDWRKGVPGLTHIHEGRTLQGLLWIGSFLSLAAGGYSEYQAANQVAAHMERNYLQKYFTNPAYNSLLSGFINVTPNSPEFNLLALSTFQDYAKSKSSYRKHRQNQGILGGTALVVYVTQILHASLIGRSETAIRQKPKKEPDSFFSLQIIPETNGKNHTELKYSIRF